MPSVMFIAILSVTNSVFSIFYVKIAMDNLLCPLKDRKHLLGFWIFSIIGEIIGFFYTLSLPEIRSISNVIITVLLNLTVYLLQSLFYKTGWLSRVFTILVIQLINGLGEFISIAILQNLLDMEANSFMTDCIISFSCQIVAFFFLLLTILFWRRRIQKYPVQYKLSVLIMPLVSYLILFSITGNRLGSQDTPFLPLALCGTLLMNILNYYLLENMLKAQTLAYQKEFLEKTISMQKQHFDSLTTAYRNTRHIIHDTKKHICYLKTGIEQGKTAELIPSMNSFLDDLESSYIHINSGNLPIDALVGNYKRMAMENQIEFKDSISIDRSLIQLPDYDMCIILGNLLDNAYQASCNLSDKKESFISLTIVTKNRKLIIEVINACQPDDKKKLRDNTEHGYGLENIMLHVKKWNGEFLYGIEEDKCYHAAIVIPLPLA